MLINHSLPNYHQRPLSTEASLFSKNKNIDKQKKFKGNKQSFLLIWNRARHAERILESHFDRPLESTDSVMPSLIHRNIEVVKWNKTDGITFTIDRRFFISLLTAFILFLKIRSVAGSQTCYSEEAWAPNPSIDQLCKNGLGAKKMALEYATVTYDNLMDEIYEKNSIIRSTIQITNIFDKWNNNHCNYTNQILSKYLPDCKKQFSQDATCMPNKDYYAKQDPCEKIERTLYSNHQSYKDLLRITINKIPDIFGIFNTHTILDFNTKEQFKKDFKEQACDEYKEPIEDTSTWRIGDFCKIYVPTSNTDKVLTLFVWMNFMALSFATGVTAVVTYQRLRKRRIVEVNRNLYEASL